MKKIIERFGLLFLITLIILGGNYLHAADAGNFSQLPSAPATSTLMAVGDINFCDIDDYILKDPSYPWAGVKDIFQTATILMGNQEVPYSNRGSIYIKKKWTLRSNPKTADALSAAGFKVVTLANNHIMDFGPIAMQDTLNTLDSLNIAHTGAGMNLDEARRAVIITTADGFKIAFLAYSLVYPEQFWAGPSRPGTPYGDPSYFVPDIKKAKTMADMVVVSFHWSDEMHFYPSDYQIVDGHKCIDAGASIVIGHHPHVLQGVEVYKNGLIAYSLGNFLFGTRSSKVKDSAILAIDYDRTGLIRAKIYPVNINNYEVNFQTKLRHGADAERVLQDLRTYSKGFQTVIESQGDVGMIRIRE